MSVATHSGEHDEPTTAEVTADALDPLIGQVVDGRFRIVDIIGRGAMGKVYRAVQLPLNRAVALKVLDSRYGAGKDETFKQRFLVEAALTSKLNHPNTVRVLDYGTRDGLFFLAMEYLDGETLEKLLSRGPLPWHRVLNIGVQMARALREAHELGVVHRDLKPANVVLLHADDDADFVKVLDFGLVKSFVDGHELEGRAITQQGMLMGSPPYMAPEQGEKNRADPRSDIYSLGTMLFEMLTGAPPFNGGGALEVILKHVHNPVPPIVAPSKFEAVPEGLQAILNKCLAKSPMDRFQSMDELLLAMQDVVVPARLVEPPPAPKPTVTEPTPMIVAPEPIVIQRGPSALLVGGFLLAAVTGVVVTYFLARPTAPLAVAFHVESSPVGADVFVDGKKLGVTPIELEQLLGQNTRGAMELKLEKPGFAPVMVKLAAGGGRIEVMQTLSPLPEPKPVVAAPVAKVEPVKPPPAPVPEPVKVAAPLEKPVPAPVIEPAKKPKSIATVRTVPKKQVAAPTGPKPVSKLDEEDEAAPTKSELKRPEAN
jgi:serine/threonine protein kinase